MSLRRVLLAVAFSLAAAPLFARSPGQAALDAGSAAYRRGDWETALREFRRATDLDPGLLKAWENLGWAHHRLGRDAEALRVWSDVLKVEPRNVAVLNAVGEVRLEAGAWRAAADALEASLRVSPRQDDVRLRLARAYEGLDDHEAAAREYRALLTSPRVGAKAALRLAEIEESRGDLAAARTVLAEAMARHPDARDALTKRAGRVAAALASRAYDAGDFAAARDGWSEAQRWDGTNPRYLIDLGWAERKAGDPAAAVAAWTRALALDPAEPAKLLRQIGDAQRDAGRLDEARDAYTRSAALDPSASGALYPLAGLQFAAGDRAAAERTLAAMLASGDPDAETSVRVADLFIRNGAVAEGRAFFEARRAAGAPAERTGPALARLIAAEGGEAYRAGDAETAAARYREALAADPRNRAALRDSGWASWKQGDWDGVARAWNGYAAAYPDAPEPHELLGRLALNRRDYPRAVEEAERALALGAQDPRGPTMVRIRGLLGSGRYATARAAAAELAAGRAEDLQVQTLYGETLWRALDFPAAREQWRKVLDLGSDSPRAMHYWLRSTYETGDYDLAVAEARRVAEGPKPLEPVLRLLAEDALVRNEDAEAARLYERLARLYPQRNAYWTAASEAYSRLERPKDAAAVLDLGLTLKPGDRTLRLRLAEIHRENGDPKRALGEFIELEGELGRNRTVFQGIVASLDDLGRHREALSRLDSNHDAFLKGYDLSFERASLLDQLGRRGEAAAIRRAVGSPPAGTVYVPILLYHGLATHPRSLSMSVDLFESQMRALVAAGYAAITVEDLDGMIAGRQPFPARPILITFDDGRQDSLRLGDPILARHGLRATMFLPTVRIADESASNADWRWIRELRATGRWDFQSHGHLAHDPLVVDEQGNVAEFLVNREWLSDEGRFETRDEYLARVDEDYAECRRRIEDHVPGERVVGYAFPFSEMGQLHGGNEPRSFVDNEEAFRKHYTYGFVQDGSGFNAVSPGPAGPRLMWRFNVPRDWDGERLLTHLAANAPATVARLEAAKSELWSGHVDRAEATFRKVMSDVPRAVPEAAAYLSRTLQEQDRPREAARYLAESPVALATDRPDAFRRRLGRELGWENDPTAGAALRVVSDSDRRDSLEAGATGRFAFEAPLDLTGQVQAVRFEDKTLPSLRGSEVTLGAAWTGAERVRVDGWLRGRSLTDGVRTLNGRAGAAFRWDRHRTGLQCGVEDVGTVGALREGIEARGCEAAWSYAADPWRARARLTYADYKDGNASVWGWGDFFRDVGGRGAFEAGFRVEAGNSRTLSPLYYTPEGLVSGMALGRWRKLWPGGDLLEAEAGIGAARDDRSGGRGVGRAALAWSAYWTPRLRSIAGLEYGATPSYRRLTATVSLDYRF